MPATWNLTGRAHGTLRWAPQAGGLPNSDSSTAKDRGLLGFGIMRRGSKFEGLAGRAICDEPLRHSPHRDLIATTSLL